MLQSTKRISVGSQPQRTTHFLRLHGPGSPLLSKPVSPVLISRTEGITRATLLPGSSADTQRIVAGAIDAEVPVAAVQKLPVPLQSAVFFGLLAGLGLSTYLLCANTSLEWAQSAAAPYIFGVTFTAAGVGHFIIHDEFCTMMPHQGAWGLWYLPGSDSFHVNWTGVAEVLGGVGLLASTLPPVAAAAPWLRDAAAYGLFALAVAVTPSNIYMFTHNAPGPGPKGTVIPAAGHAARGVMQVVLWTALWGLAHSPVTV